MKNQELIEDLISKTKNHILRTEKLLELSDSQLTAKKTDEWNVLECCEHLNLYFEFYLPEISEKIKLSKSKNSENFTPGILGSYFVKAISPKQKLNKMKTAPDKNPHGRILTKTSVENLVQNFNQFLAILEDSKSTNLNKIKIKTSFSNLIQLKLGDTLRFIVNHNERHLQQAERLVKINSALPSAF